jgi:mono/diheme cytochrome c family protein
MKKLQALAFLAATLGLIAYQGTWAPIYAASGGTPSASADQSGAAHMAAPLGAESYANHCAICHGEQREGILPAFPPLIGIGRQLKDQQVADLIHSGKGRMPGFPNLQHEELAALLHYLASSDITVPATGTVAEAAVQKLAAANSNIGSSLYLQNCAFCHGRDAAGGETGPDLTRSKLVLADVAGDKISEVVRNGRPEKKMPGFNLSSQEMDSLAAFIHTQVANAAAHKGSRRGVDVADLQTGNIEAGKQYFNGAGTCSTCHSAKGDLAGVASRYEGLQLEERMLYPSDVKSRVTVTLPSNRKMAGTLAYLDEFTVGLRDVDGSYHSWPITEVKYAVDAPVEAHADLFSKYTDADIHNLMAYLQTLR